MADFVNGLMAFLAPAMVLGLVAAGLAIMCGQQKHAAKIAFWPFTLVLFPMANGLWKGSVKPYLKKVGGAANTLLAFLAIVAILAVALGFFRP